MSNSTLPSLQVLAASVLPSSSTLANWWHCWLNGSCGGATFLSPEITSLQQWHEYRILKVNWTVEERIMGLVALLVAGQLVSRLFAALFAVLTAPCRWRRRAHRPRPPDPHVRPVKHINRTQGAQTDGADEAAKAKALAAQHEAALASLQQDADAAQTELKAQLLKLQEQYDAQVQQASVAESASQKEAERVAAAHQQAEKATRQKVTALEAEKQSLEAQKQSLEGEKQSLESDKKSLEARKTSLEAETASLKDENKSLLTQAFAKEEKVAALTEKLSKEVKAHERRVSASSSSSKGSLDDMKQVQTLTSENKALEASLARAKKERDERNAKDLAQLQQIEELVAKNKELQAQADEATAAATTAATERANQLEAQAATEDETKRAALAQAAEETRSVREQLDLVTAERDQAQSESSDLRAQLEQQSAAASSTTAAQPAPIDETQLTELRTRLDTEVAQSAKLRERLAAVESGEKEAVAAHESQVTQLRQAATLAQEELAATRHKSATVLAATERHRVESEQHRVELEQKVAEVAEADTVINKLLARVKDAETALAAAYSALEDLNTKTRLLEERLAEYEQMTPAQSAAATAAAVALQESKEKTLADANDGKESAQPISISTTASPDRREPALARGASDASTESPSAPSSAIRPNARSRASSALLAAPGAGADGPTPELRNVWNRLSISYQDRGSVVRAEEEKMVRDVTALVDRFERMLKEAASPNNDNTAAAHSSDSDSDSEDEEAESRAAAATLKLQQAGSTTSDAPPPPPTPRDQLSARITQLTTLYRTVARELRHRRAETLAPAVASTSASEPAVTAPTHTEAPEQSQPPITDAVAEVAASATAEPLAVLITPPVVADAPPSSSVDSTEVPTEAVVDAPPRKQSPQPQPKSSPKHNRTKSKQQQRRSGRK